MSNRYLHYVFFSECGLKFYVENCVDFQFLVKCFRAIAFVPLEYVEAAYIALVNSPLYKELVPEVFFKKGGRVDTLEMFRDKLKTFCLYFRVSKTYILLLCIEKNIIRSSYEM